MQVVGAVEVVEEDRRVFVAAHDRSDCVGNWSVRALVSVPWHPRPVCRLGSFAIHGPGGSPSHARSC